MDVVFVEGDSEGGGDVLGERVDHRKGVGRGGGGPARKGLWGARGMRGRGSWGWGWAGAGASGSCVWSRSLAAVAGDRESGEDRAGPYLCTRMAEEEESKGVSAGREGGSVWRRWRAERRGERANEAPARGVGAPQVPRAGLSPDLECCAHSDSAINHSPLRSFQTRHNSSRYSHSQTLFAS